MSTKATYEQLASALRWALTQFDGILEEGLHGFTPVDIERWDENRRASEHYSSLAGPVGPEPCELVADNDVMFAAPAGSDERRKQLDKIFNSPESSGPPGSDSDDEPGILEESWR